MAPTLHSPADATTKRGEHLFQFTIEGRAPKPALPEVDVADALRRRSWLGETLLEASTTRPQRPVTQVVTSAIMHVVILTIAVLLPLWFTDAIDLTAFTQTILVAPPPPPPPPPPPAEGIVRAAAKVRRVFTSGGHLLAPVAIPQQVAMLKEEPLAPDIGAVGVVGGVPGGVPGGQVGGVLGGILAGQTRTPNLAPPVAEPRAPIRVGGRIRRPKELYAPSPTYPVLAKQARIQGQVVIDAVIDKNGNVIEMQAISGHPLLIPAALEILKTWRYEPTYLNDETIPVQLVVTIHFRLT